VIRHVVMFRWAEEAPADAAERVAAALRTLPDAIPEIRRYDLGPDAGINEGSFDFVVVADFDDTASYLVYRDHPAHQRVIREVILPVVGQRAAVQYEVP
jgi:hypothetical protein